MVYKAAKGSRLSDEQAQVFGERIDLLQQENEGQVTPQVVLQDAAQETSPLHTFFTWDDTAAAQKYRLNEARYLLRSIHVVIEAQNTEHITRAFHRVEIIDEPEDNHQQEHQVERVYVTAKTAFTNEDYRRQTIEAALRELESWRQRYKQYQELAHIFQFIDTIQERLELVPAVVPVTA